jgi:anaerobic carbon-monoxide dehydrogenase catalytic subunit
MIPNVKVSTIVGFSVETIKQALNGISPENDGFKVLTDLIKDGTLRGIAAIVGCNNPKIRGDEAHRNIIKDLIENDILVVATGCAAQAAAKVGFMNREAIESAGPGLQKICYLLGIPPVLHMGSCVDNSRILKLTSKVASYLGIDISDLPVVGIAPEWMSEKAISIGCYVVASGIDTFLGINPPVTGSPNVVHFLVDKIENITKAKFFVNENYKELSKMIINNIDEKREKLGIVECIRK